MTSLSQREYKVEMPFDDETALIDLDKRFMLEIINGEPKTYVTTSVDQSTERYELHGKTQGFLVLNIRQDQYNSKTDNAEKMICTEIAKWKFVCLEEFKEFVETQTADDGTFKIRILNNSIMDGSTVRISLANADGTANTSIECKVVSLL